MSQRGWLLAATLLALSLGCQTQAAPAPPEPATAVAGDNVDDPHEVTGIGIRPVMHAKGFAIGQLFPDGPAAEAGLREGDVVLTVDGEPTTRWTLDRVSRRLRSAAGTKVTLTVERGDQRFPVELVRRVVAVPDRRP